MVTKDVASMGRLLRAGFDMHFTNSGHTCWMERAGQVCKIYEDDPNSEAPLYNLKVKVLPPPGDAQCPLQVAPLFHHDLYDNRDVHDSIDTIFALDHSAAIRSIRFRSEI